MCIFTIPDAFLLLNCRLNNNGVTMKIWINRATSMLVLSLLSVATYATPTVPEIDGSSAAIALGLTAGIVALNPVQWL